MPATTHTRTRTGRTLAGLAGLAALIAIGLLANNVAREMQSLRSARSDNAQWSLAQTEVEFLDFVNAVNLFEEPPDRIRRRFDIFYSRVNTIEVAEVYEKLRQSDQFASQLALTRTFLNEAVTIVDLSDEDFIAQQDALKTLAQDARTTVRGLSNAGLSIFAANADRQREAVAGTVAQLAVALVVFVGALATSILYLNRLNTINITRERAQKEIATRMNTVIETSLDGIIVSNDYGEIIEFSQAAEKIFGYAAAEAIGQDVAHIITPKTVQNEQRTGLQRVSRGGLQHMIGAGRRRMDASRKDGSVFPIELSIQAAELHDSKIYVVFVRDVSRVVAAEQELVTARDAALEGEKIKTDFVATMSHEIRTPLNGLLGNLSLMQDTELTSQQDRYMRNMETSGRLLMSHISDVLDITRYDAGKLKVTTDPMNISILVQDIIDNQSAMAVSSDTTLRWHWIGESRDWVLSDPDRVQLVLINLISNAVKFTRAGEVLVTAEIGDNNATSSDNIVFCIQDTGPGMTEELANRIFDDFVTGNAAFDREVGGTGLGLSIAKRFVDALGGVISVETEVGKGSVFKVILPMPQAEKPVDVYATPKTVPPSTILSILLVDDNDINRILAREMLENAGHKVVEAHNGKSGVEAAAETRFDLIFMDISMPVMDGRTAARKIRSGHGKSAQTPIVALTAHALPEDQAAFKEDGMVATLTKPLSKNSLLDVLRSTELQTVPDAETRDQGDVYRSKAYGKMLKRFISETDSFVEWSQTSSLPLDDIADQAHKIAGSAATFQSKAFANSLSDLSVAARAGEVTFVGHALQELPTEWQDTKRGLLERS
ncbi:ATP-binding protein [Loktanella sp. F6476L]|uniref:hybrid sensor histidine kinase/response regulator n=1 Tax=Loktanella sp. F6476L TaxID=2926405 RepID=UPI001FF0DF21|nr:ATP-binding protein [Loktanella sp. F6476L]